MKLDEELSSSKQYFFRSNLMGPTQKLLPKCIFMLSRIHIFKINIVLKPKLGFSETEKRRTELMNVLLTYFIYQNN